MKVLHVIPSVDERSGGPAQAIFPMCQALKANGVEVHLTTTNAGLDLNGTSLCTPVNYRDVCTTFFPLQWGSSFKFSRRLSLWLDKNVAQFDLVHIHAVFNHSCVAAAAACRRHRVPYVVRPLGTLHPWGMQQNKFVKKMFWTLTGERMLNAAATIHYTTEAEKQAVENSLGISKGTVVPLGIDSGIAELPLSDAKGATPPDSSYMLLLSRLHRKKGIEILIQAFEKLSNEEEFKDWRLVLAGEGEETYVQSLRDKAALGRAADRIIFAGWLEGADKRLFLRKSALLVLPSYTENFGVCVMEALSCGVPVVISPHVDLASSINASGAGWIAEVNCDDLAAKLREAFRSKEERVRRGNAGKTLSLKFTWPAVADQLVAMYSRLLGSGN